jgi:hypothetical protein
VQVNAKNEIRTNLNVFCDALFMNALSTGDKKYSKRYALINQFSLVAKTQPANPPGDILLTPIIIVMMYSPIRKNRHWYKKLHNPLKDGLIPNQPDMRTNTLTHTILTDSKNMRKKASSGLCCISFTLGEPKEKKSACTSSTRNIANIRNNSMFDNLTLFLSPVAVICVGFYF